MNEETRRRRGDIQHRINEAFLDLDAATRQALIIAVKDEAPISVVRFLVDVLEGETDLGESFDGSVSIPEQEVLPEALVPAFSAVQSALSTLLGAMAEENEFERSL